MVVRNTFIVARMADVVLVRIQLTGDPRVEELARVSLLYYGHRYQTFCCSHCDRNGVHCRFTSTPTEKARPAEHGTRATGPVGEWLYGCTEQTKLSANEGAATLQLYCRTAAVL